MLRSALDQLTSAASSSRARQVLEIPVNNVDPDPDQPRKTFEDLDTLTASIAVLGIKQPLLVRNHSEERDRYVLIAGERRLRAARQAGLQTVPCLLETGDSVEPGELVITQLTENLQRKDVAILETAQALEKALETTGMTKGELARALGKGPSFVSKHLALLKAAGPARQALKEGLLISTETYRQFSALPEARQRDLLKEARLRGEPIARSQVEGLPSRRNDARSPQSPGGKAQSAQAGGRKGQSKKPRRNAKTTETTETSFNFRFSADQVRRIIQRFNVEPPSDPSRLKPKLLELLVDEAS